MLYRLLFLLGSISSVLTVTVIRVDGEYRNSADLNGNHFQRRREKALQFNRRRSNVILAPLEDRRIITKDQMYVNANEEKDDLIYEKIMADPKVAVDSFFVTEPPIRTKMPEREEPNVILTTPMPTLETPLRLVTLPKLATTTPPPFKYTSKAPAIAREAPTFGLNPLPQFDISNSQTVRFPAQSWQIPPRDPQRPYNPWEHLFEPPKLFPGLQPPNPFLQPNQTTNPFIPIGVSNPAPLNVYPNYGAPKPTQLQPLPTLSPIQPPFVPPTSHKSPLRTSGFAKHAAEMNPIPLPSDPFSYGSDQRVPKSIISPPDFSIDSRPILLNKDESYKNGAKVFVSSTSQRPQIESGSDQLKNFAKNHPHIMTTGKRPIMKESQLVLPKSIQSNRALVPVATLSPPIAPVSNLTPNQKLYLCCQKQQVGTACQTMCNFDTFSDKSLVSAFLTNQCPGPQLGKAYDCASSKADHTACCERNGISSVLGGRCMPFCRTHLSTPANVFDYLPCLQVFETIKYCYREYQVNNRNIFGD